MKRKYIKNHLVAASALFLASCVTVDGKGLSVDGTCIVCVTTQGNARASVNKQVRKEGIVLETSFNSPIDVDSTYALLKDEFDYLTPKEISRRSGPTIGEMYVMQEIYSHETRQGAYYRISDKISHPKNVKANSIVGFQILKYGKRAKIKLRYDGRLSDNDAENKRLMNQRLSEIKQRALRALR